MDLEDFLYELDYFVESRRFLNTDDGDPDEYRKGYRAGYWDALVYIQDWLREASEEEGQS